MREEIQEIRKTEDDGLGTNTPSVKKEKQPVKTSYNVKFTKSQKTWLIIGGTIIAGLFISAIVYSFINIDKW